MKRFSLLVLSPDEVFLGSLSAAMGRLDWAAYIVDSAHKAVEELKLRPFDAVILDGDTQDLNLNNLIAQVKQIRSEAPLFVITSQEENKQKSSLDSKDMPVLKKPVEAGTIAGFLKNLEAGVPQKNVLIIEDNEDDGAALSEILREKGFTPAAVTSAEEAIELLHQRSFQAVLLDMELPGTDGVEALGRIKAASPSSGIIAITGYSLDEVIDRIITGGAYTCFIKPFDVELLIKEIDLLIERGAVNGFDESSCSKAPLILLAEDNDDIRASMKEVLESEGYVVSAAGSVPEAEKLIEQDGFDLVLSDLSLGSQSGLSLVEKARAKNRFASFILMTGYGSMETAIEAVNRDVDEYLLKPVRPPDLINKVKTYLEKHRLCREKAQLSGKLKESNVKLFELSKLDGLTGAFNRIHFFEQLHTEMIRAVRSHSSVGVFMCDVDGFRKFNETYGEQEGNKVLKEAAAVFGRSVRHYVDQVFRYGADEFSVIAPGMKKETAQRIAKRILDSAAHSLASKGINISIGISIYSEDNHGLTMNGLIDIAEKKLYEAKHLGGGQFVI